MRVTYKSVLHSLAKDYGYTGSPNYPAELWSYIQGGIAREVVTAKAPLLEQNALLRGQLEMTERAITVQRLIAEAETLWKWAGRFVGVDMREADSLVDAMRERADKASREARALSLKTKGESNGSD